LAHDYQSCFMSDKYTSRIPLCILSEPIGGQCVNRRGLWHRHSSYHQEACPLHLTHARRFTRARHECQQASCATTTTEPSMSGCWPAYAPHVVRRYHTQPASIRCLHPAPDPRLLTPWSFLTRGLHHAPSRASQAHNGPRTPHTVPSALIIALKVSVRCQRPNEPLPRATLRNSCQNRNMCTGKRPRSII
jgi:hypothetical protein